MAVPDDTTPRPSSGGDSPELPAEDMGEEKPLLRRIGDRWNSLGLAGKAVVIGGAVVGGVIVLARIGAIASGSGSDCNQDSTDDSSGDRTAQGEEQRWSTNAGGYWHCTHIGCTKKANPTILGHGCCGRCRLGRECLKAAQRDYDGPGGFAHNFFDTWLNPGVCMTCGEGPEAHPYEYDRLRGERR
ncbi:hypothetical protein ACFTZ8_26670 [Streptomyces fungicidicus]|uniref:hypothetical protein n=1 Tax=Streptomyces fungicidicus TaxID=68203 RepID=UPI00363378F2